MPTAKQGSKKKPVKQKQGPKTDRPKMPTVYGIPKDKKGLLPWAHVSERVAKSRHYWVATVDPNGRPHSTAVDGLWVDDQLYFGGNPTTRRHRNLIANPAVCVHLESATDVVVLYGDAREVRADRLLSARLAEASKEKYGYGPPPGAYESGGVWVLKPRKVIAWTQFPKDCTRWRFDNDD